MKQLCARSRRTLTTPKAFLFDMDGLLLVTERVMLEVGIKMAAERGVQEDQATPFFLSLIGSSSDWTRERTAEFFPADGARFYDDWYVQVGARLATQIPLRPTVRKTLSLLYRDGARMAVVTLTKGDMARAHLQHAGVLGYFEAVIGGDEVSANKPDPAPYQEAAERLGLKAEDCAVFEDSDRGIASAVRAECHAVQIPDRRPENTPLPELGQNVTATLEEAVELVRHPS